MPKVLIAAGGTGGHLIPAQQLAELLLQKYPCEVLFAGFKLETSPYFNRSRFPFREVASAPLNRNPLPLGRGFLDALRLIRRENPAVVAGFGSYHTAPILLAAAVLRKKIVLYEANRVMGKVTRLFAPFAEAVAIQLPLVGHKRKNTVFVPLFPWIVQEANRDAARLEFGLESNRQTILVFGGSQGAQFLNETIPEVLKGRSDVQVIHLSGNEASAEEVRKRYKEAQVHAAVKGFESNMALAYAASDFAICRSGAGTTAELIRHKLPALLIPYPFAAEDHQRHNAEFLESLAVASCLLQKNATVKAIEERLCTLDWNGMRLAFGAKKEQDDVPIEALVAKVGGFGLCIT